MPGNALEPRARLTHSRRTVSLRRGGESEVVWPYQQPSGVVALDVDRGGDGRGRNVVVQGVWREGKS